MGFDKLLESLLDEWQYKWKPSAAQRKAFALKMQDPEAKAEYEDKKLHKAQARRATSKFDYEIAGGKYIPTKQQYDFVSANYNKFVTPEEKLAADVVVSGYTCNQKVHHDYIHIVNDKLRGTNESIDDSEDGELSKIIGKMYELGYSVSSKQILDGDLILEFVNGDKVIEIKIKNTN
jgi:hypothetical protein